MRIAKRKFKRFLIILMEELHADSIDGGHEGQLWARSRARERAYSNKYGLLFRPFTSVFWRPRRGQNGRIATIKF
jgi:hypothetical protein